MHIYEIKDNTGIKCIITDDPQEIAELTASGWYPSETPIQWSTQRLVDGVLEDIPVPPVPEPTPLTADQVKQQKYAEINMEYSAKLRKISKARVLAENTGLPTDTLIALYKSMLSERKAKILEVYNGETTVTIK